MQLMQGAILACLVALPVSLAQSSSDSALAQLPDCATKCFASAHADSECSPTDTTCRCTNEKLQQDITICVAGTCTVKEAMFTKNATMTACGAPVRNRTPSFVTENAILGVLSGLFVFQRFATKIFYKLPLGLDDWFILLTILVGIPCMAINSHGLAPNGMGKDIWTLAPDQITKFSMFFHTMATLYFALMTLLKLSLLFFYLRIFPTPVVRKALWGTVAFTCAFGLVYVFVAIFQCQPISYFWTKWDGEHEGKCANINAVTWSNASINIALDFYILGIPLSQLRALNLDWRKKIGVGMMFSVGIFVTVMSILRLVATLKLGTANPTWEFFELSRWSTIEINVGIICACMPSLRVLLVRLFPKLLGTSQRYYNYGGNKPTGGNTNKSRTLPLGTNATSQVDRSQRGRIDRAGITCHRTYEVEYGDNDETLLVYMKDLDRKSATSEARSEVSV
ncbi:hypothetical protein IWW34DRAFT_884725 [Fusarium oxysporum f. sp. albedinis]|nr:hypothetical protein IWW34DRAFT_884725 [Fusarium oxysporum f. sp. albedinis]KAJ0132992.1 Uncharacterized protein HZ326_23929 [Fusarium oxysporum f. sp. albedinis]KAK2468294.1 hypothetical protein H9L39_19940 [Fusarium oxysporum f. sp. albedinis]